MVMQVRIIRNKMENESGGTAHWVAMSSICETEVCCRP